MVEVKTDLKQLKTFIKKVAKTLDLDKVILFGSRAYGKPTVDSDYDLIVVSKDFEGTKFYKRSANLYLSWNLDAPVDFICLTPKEFEEKASRATVVKHAFQKGLEII